MSCYTTCHLELTCTEAAWPINGNTEPDTHNSTTTTTRAVSCSLLETGTLLITNMSIPFLTQVPQRALVNIFGQIVARHTSFRFSSLLDLLTTRFGWWTINWRRFRRKPVSQLKDKKTFELVMGWCISGRGNGWMRSTNLEEVTSEIMLGDIWLSPPRPTGLLRHPHLGVACKLHLRCRGMRQISRFTARILLLRSPSSDPDATYMSSQVWSI